jgi:hypothetical protein
LKTGEGYGSTRNVEVHSHLTLPSTSTRFAVLAKP